jgi:hypothetical protein
MYLIKMYTRYSKGTPPQFYQHDAPALYNNDAIKNTWFTRFFFFVCFDMFTQDVRYLN